MKKQEDTLVKEKIDSSAVAVHAMSAFTDSITAAHQYNNGSAIATAAGQMAIGMPHGVPGNPHVSSANGFPTHSMMSTPPFGMSMKNFSFHVFFSNMRPRDSGTLPTI